MPHLRMQAATALSQELQQALAAAICDPAVQRLFQHSCIVSTRLVCILRSKCSGHAAAALYKPGMQAALDRKNT